MQVTGSQRYSTAMILFVPVPCETLKFSDFWKTNLWMARGKPGFGTFRSSTGCCDRRASYALGPNNPPIRTSKALMKALFIVIAVIMSLGTLQAQDFLFPFFVHHHH